MIFDKHSKEALRLIDEGKNLFITGKAGTGKTTLLGEVVKRLDEKRVISVVLAPTGVAAENADGVTLHSFLRLPLTPFIPHHRYSNLYSLDDHAIEVVKKLDVIIIDEISMVRCDMLDAADMILRHLFKTLHLIDFSENSTKNKSHPKVTLKWSRGDQVLLPALSGVVKILF